MAAEGGCGIDEANIYSLHVYRCDCGRNSAVELASNTIQPFLVVRVEPDDLEANRA